MILPELLAPAGNSECVQAAFDHGADAVYAGLGQFNLRAHCANFTVDELPDLLDIAHGKGKCLYAALNTMPDDTVLDQIRLMLVDLNRKDYYPDAFIISDPGVIAMCKEIVPSVPLHLSTQTGTFNSGAFSFWKQQGIARVILPREMNSAQVKMLTDKNILETEIFIHGAMCVSISGRCLLGAYLAGRHPNYGDCPQPCRIAYDIRPSQTDDDGFLHAQESSDGVYLLNSKDLCTIDILPEIVATGVKSLKIEGRNKSVNYVSTVVKVYREALDKIGENGTWFVDPEWKKELDSVDHRPYTTGFFKNELQLQEVFTAKVTSGYRMVGIVKGVVAGGDPVIDVRNSFAPGEPLNVFPVQKKIPSYQTSFVTLTDISGNPVARASANRLVIGNGGGRLREGDILRRIV